MKREDIEKAAGGVFRQENSTGACYRSEALPSTGGDSPQTGKASARQWLHKVLGGISALVKDYPIYAEYPDGLLPKQTPPQGRPGFQDSCEPKGHSAGETVLGYAPGGKPDFEDGTWMTVRIPIPQTIQGRKSRPTVPRQSGGGNTHGQTGTATDGYRPVKDAETTDSCKKGEKGGCADVGTYAPD